MLVFFKQRLAFLAMPKTGSTAYESALAPYADLALTNPPALKHAPVYRYNRFIRPLYKNVCDVELELIAVMRDPTDWLGSWYRYRRRPSMKGHPNATSGISFDDFVRAYCKGTRPPFADVGSQAKFLKSQSNGTAVSHLFSYENQPRLKNFLTRKLGIQFELEIENASPRMTLELSPETRKLFRRKCAVEFDLYDSIPI